MEDTLEKKPFDYIGNAVAYGYIIYKNDFFYIYSGTLLDVDIDTVPPSHHDGTCQCVEEYAREIVEEQIRSRNDQQDVEGTEKLPPIPTESIQEEPAVDPRNAMPETGHVESQVSLNTRQSCSRSTSFLIIENLQEEASNKKMPRKTVFTTISAKLRSAGVNISRNPGSKFMVGNRAIVTPKALSSSLPMEKRVWETGVQEAAQELAMIQQENEYLVADGIITAEEAASAEAAITKIQLQFGFCETCILLTLFLLEKIELFERRQRERDEQTAKRDLYIQETEAQKIKIASSLVDVLSSIVHK
ncbi:Uncharacterized protein APZ42_028492 [Daphnia magna]|uniref:Uncharacterized protein n=1 Tax=Daphnia magna TaxID=35525 RepID=A0A164QGH9_9CRUS|nr:Uncharacterized protein APZ42_028492 [Daphnia magna]